MNKILLILLTLIASYYLTGCISVPMASLEADTARKEFSSPSQDISGLYIFRTPLPSYQDILVKRSIYLDDELIGDSLPKTYFYREVQPGKHKLSTESEFSNNDLTIDIKGGRNYFIRQYLKMGLLSAATGIELVSEEEGRKRVLKSKLAK